jgi:hypothetical protein
MYLVPALKVGQHGYNDGHKDKTRDAYGKKADIH